MVVGIPGTGIGGLFYLMLAFLMPVHELWLLCRGRSSWRRWRMVAAQVANASGVVASMLVAARLVRFVAEYALENSAGTASPGSLQAAMQQVRAVTTASLAWLTMAALAAVVIGVIVLGELLALVHRVHGRQRPLAQQRLSKAA